MEMQIEMKRCLLITVISFILLFIYYVVVKQFYVTELSDDTSRVLSLRLCIVYAIMFSSALSLLYLCIISFQSTKEDEKNNIKVEESTFNGL